MYTMFIIRTAAVKLHEMVVGQRINKAYIFRSNSITILGGRGIGILNMPYCIFVCFNSLQYQLYKASSRNECLRTLWFFPLFVEFSECFFDKWDFSKSSLKSANYQVFCNGSLLSVNSQWYCVSVFIDIMVVLRCRAEVIHCGNKAWCPLLFFYLWWPHFQTSLWDCYVAHNLGTKGTRGKGVVFSPLINHWCVLGGTWIQTIMCHLQFSFPCTKHPKGRFSLTWWVSLPEAPHSLGCYCHVLIDQCGNIQFAVSLQCFTSICNSGL